MQNRELQYIECAYLLKELKTLENSYFSKFYQISENEFRIKFNNAQVNIFLPYYISIAKYIKPAEITAFAEKVRNILDNEKLLNVDLINRDRIFLFSFKNFNFIVELFSKGNLVITDKNYKILEALREESWKTRAIKKGEIYSPPPNDLKDNIRDTLSSKYIVVCLLKLPLGKIYVKELLERCKIDEKKSGSELNEEEINCLERAYSNLLNDLKPIGFFERDKIVDFSLSDLKIYEHLEKKFYPSLSEVIEDFSFSTKKFFKSEKVEKLKKRLEEQLELLKKLELEEEEQRKKGNFFYENFSLIEKIIQEAQKYSFSNFPQTICGFKVTNIDGKNKEIEIEIN